MRRLVLIGALLGSIPGYVLVPELHAQDAGTFVFGDEPAWLGAHCAGGPNAGATCIMRLGDQPGQAADCPESDCTTPTEPPPSDWRSRATGTTQFADAVEGQTVAIPRNPDGTCAHVSLLGTFSPGGTPDSFDRKKFDYIIAQDEGNCAVTVKKGKVKRRPFPLTPSGFARSPGGARLPNGISAVKWFVRIRMSLRNYNYYPSLGEFGVSNAFSYWDYGSGGLAVLDPRYYRDHFFWNNYEGWYPAWCDSLWDNIESPSRGGTSMAACSYSHVYSVYGEEGYVSAYEQAWGDAGYMGYCYPSWVNTTAINWRWRCRGWQVLKTYY